MSSIALFIFASSAPVKDDSAADEQNNTRRGRPALHNKVIRFCTMADDDKVTKVSGTDSKGH